MKAGSAGFTLVELLVSMTVLAFLTLLLFGGLHFGARAWERSEAENSSTDEVRHVRAVLQRAIERAFPPNVYSDPQDAHLAFRGDQSDLVVLAPAPHALMGAGRAYISFVRRQVGPDLQLIIKAQPELAAEGQGVWQASLLQHLALVKFTYFGADSLDETPVWRDRWTSSKTLPLLVRVQVVFPAGDARVWPDLVVAPRLLVDADCVYDVQNHRCQNHQ